MKGYKQNDMLTSRVIQGNSQRGNLRFVDNRPDNNMSAQLKKVRVQNGLFETTKFDKEKKHNAIIGIDMELKFTPIRGLTPSDKKIGFIQIFKRMNSDEIKPTHRLRIDTNENILDRSITYTNPIYGTENLGIGQNIIDSTPIEGDAKSGKNKGKYVKLTTFGDTATPNPAIMNDNPESYDGGMMFQTSAVGLENKAYYGTVKWGFTPGKSYDIVEVTSPADVTTAVSKWNTEGHAQGNLILNSSLHIGDQIYPAGTINNTPKIGRTWVKGFINRSSVKLPFCLVNDDKSGLPVKPFL